MKWVEGKLRSEQIYKLPAKKKAFISGKNLLKNLSGNPPEITDKPIKKY